MKKRNTIITLLFLILTQFICAQSQTSLVISLPTKDYKWKLISKEDQNFSEYIPETETTQNWTVDVFINTYKATSGNDINSITNNLTEGIKKNRPNSTVTTIDKSTSSKHPFIIFKIEMTSSTSTNPMSSICLVIEGDKDYYDFIMVTKKQKNLTTEFINEWAKIFKAGYYKTI